MGLNHTHYLFVKDNRIIKDPETGEILPNNEEYRFVSKCREQVNGSGKLISGTDGNTIAFNSLINLPLSCETITEGTQLIVCDDFEMTSIRFDGIALRFSKSLLHSRLWV